MAENIHFTIKGGYQYEAIHHGICFQRSWHLLKYEKALELLQVRRADHVLDAACGSGVLTGMIADKLNGKVVGVDFSEAAIHFCTNQYKQKNIDFIKLDLQQKYFSDNSFDKIVMLETIEHLEPVVAHLIVKNLYHYLKPGGKLIISTPNKYSFWPVIELLLDTFGLTPKMKNEQHVKLYTKSSLKAELRQAGFKIKSIYSSHFIAPWISFLGLKLAGKVHRAEQKLKILPGSLLFAVVEK
jgi:2-polyprenyl-3-methyl-5-hydroxy-6-metoxy-1,4-benzoquinol methylase